MAKANVSNLMVNPFAPPPKTVQTPLVSQNGNIYDPLIPRALAIANEDVVQEAIENLRTRLQGTPYKQEHFGRLEELESNLIDINVDIQRLLETPHIAKNIIELFDPRIMQPLNVIYIKETGRYSAWEGQQSGTAFALMMHFGLIEPGTLIQCKVVDDDLAVPGSTLTGEAVGNYGFRCINYKGRKAPDLFWILRSMVNGVRLYNSTLIEDKQANEIQNILQKNNMFAAPAVEARSNKAKPGMVTHISSILNIAGHGTDQEKFDVTKADLDWVMAWHNKFYASEKGIDGGYMITFGRFAALCREQEIEITKEHDLEFYQHMKRYGSPKAFHQDCQTRYKRVNGGWSDACLLPIWQKDYMKRGGTLSLPTIKNYNEYKSL
jgi:hypothetical protein